MTFTLAVIESNEDFVVIKEDFCSKCAEKKLKTLITFPLEREEAVKIIKSGIRCVRVSDECKKRT